MSVVLFCFYFHDRKKEHRNTLNFKFVAAKRHIFGTKRDNQVVRMEWRVNMRVSGEKKKHVHSQCLCFKLIGINCK